MKFFNFTKIKFPSPFVNDYKALNIKQYHEKNNPFNIMHIFGNKTLHLKLENTVQKYLKSYQLHWFAGKLDFLAVYDIK